MDKITRDIFVTRNTIKEPIAYVQATNSIPIELIFRDWSIPAGAEAKVFVTKPSGKGTYDIATIEENTVIVWPKDQTFAEEGISSLQIQIVDGDKTLVSFAVPVIVEKNNVAGDVPESENQSNFIDEYLSNIKTAIDNTEDAIEDVNAAADLAISTAENIKKKSDTGEFTGSVAIGKVKTGVAGEPASVSNSGTKKDAILDMTIPRGETGPVGKIESSTAENHQLYTVESAAILNELKGKTVQEANPAPTDPKTIKGIGSRGWFDGELLQGYRNITTGTYIDSPHYVCNKNAISCKKGDKFKIVYLSSVPTIDCVCFDSQNKVIIKKTVSNTNILEIEITEDANDFFFNVNASQVTPQTAKHITVLKNGKYCAWIKSVGENLVNPEQLVFGSVESNGNLNTYNVRCRTGFIRVDGKTVNQAVINSTAYSASSYQLYDENFKYISSSGVVTAQTKYLIILYMKKDGTAFTEADLSFLRNNTVAWFNDIVPTKYVPYKESNIQIPLDEPLWTDGKIYNVDGKYGIYQEYKESVLPIGKINLYAEPTESKILQVYMIVKGAKSVFQSSVCNRFKNINISWTKQEYGLYSDYNASGIKYFNSPNSSVKTIEQFETWLLNNKTSLVYELETPQFIPFPDSVQAQFYNLRTYDGQTTIFLVDELQTDFTVDYASNRTGNYVLSGYSKALTTESKNADPFDIGLASDTKDGLMAQTDFAKLKGIEAGAQKNPDLSEYETKGKITQKLIESDENLNNITSQGYYFADTGNKILNKPSGLNVFAMIVIKPHANHTTQIIYAGDIVPAKEYIRNKDSVGWSQWNVSYSTLYKPNKIDIGLSEVPNVTTNNQTPTFTRASALGNIVSGETLQTLFSKICMWGASFGTSAWASIQNDLTTSVSNKVLDARQGKILNDTKQPKQYLIVVPKAKLTSNMFYEKGVVNAMVGVNIPTILGLNPSAYPDWRSVLMINHYFLNYGLSTDYNEQRLNLGYQRITRIDANMALGFEISEKMDTMGIAEVTLKVGSYNDTAMTNYKNNVGDMHILVSFVSDYTSKTLT